MAINKVVYGNDTLVDLTEDSVSANTLLEGETAHDRSGNPVTGTAKQGHILQGQAGTDMTQRAKMQFLDAQVTDDSTNGKSKVEVVKQLTKAQLDALGSNTDGIYETTDEEDEEITGGGHTIKDGSGTAMTAQPNLQFVDAKVTNDAQGQVTKVQNFVDINFDDWQNVDDNDDTYYRVLNAPLADGTVEVDLMKKLWENPSPTSSFASQQITLSSADYDFLLSVFNATNSSSYRNVCVITKKGNNIFAEYAQARTDTGIGTANRILGYSTDTLYIAEDAMGSAGTTPAVVTNNQMIPVAIYGIKQKVTISIDAIAKNVRARVDYSTDEKVIGTWIDGSTLYEKTIDNITVPNNTTSSINTGLSNVWVHDYYGTVYYSNGEGVRNINETSIRTLISGTGSQISMKTTESFGSTWKACITLRYTKNS